MYREGCSVFAGWRLLQEVRTAKPLIHCMTNYVTANDTANMILATGASPVMAEAGPEVEEITALSKALVLNLGTLNESRAEAMLLAGKKAASLGHPVILDPVGAGASVFRTETARQIIKAIPCTVIRGNASEIRTLAGMRSSPRGVDADAGDRMSLSEAEEVTGRIRQLSRATGAVVVMTGEIDVVANQEDVCYLYNGHRLMTGITGTGCMMNGILAAFQAVEVSKEGTAVFPTPFWRAVYAVAAAGICGELAGEKTTAEGGGTGSFRIHYLDAMSCLGDERIKGGIKFEF